MLRVVFKLLFLASVCVYAIFAYIGYITWSQGYLGMDKSLGECFSAFLVLLFFFPGVGLVAASGYFFVYLKEAISQFIGVGIIFILIVVHVFLSIPMLHSAEIRSASLGLLEIFFIFFLIFSLHKFSFREVESVKSNQ
jgi:hypothetical protein